VQVSPAFDAQSVSPKKQPSYETFTAIWDTGATNSVITPAVAAKCSLKPTGMARVCHANGEANVETCLVNIALPNKVAFSNVKVTLMDLTDADVLIGMDIIAVGDFAVTNSDGKTTFSFRIPSIEKIDYVEEANALVQAREAKAGRNDPCPCGSGKKYKKCHGA